MASGGCMPAVAAADHSIVAGVVSSPWPRNPLACHWTLQRISCYKSPFTWTNTARGITPSSSMTTSFYWLLISPMRPKDLFYLFFTCSWEYYSVKNTNSELPNWTLHTFSSFCLPMSPLINRNFLRSILLSSIRVGTHNTETLVSNAARRRAKDVT
jgi:hypothetical protein